MSMDKTDSEREFATEKLNIKNETNEEIVAKIKAGKDTTASLQQLWLQTKGYIYRIAKRYSGYAEIEDLMQEGYIGMQLAAEHYEADRDKAFIGYLTFWLKQSMGRYIENNGSIRVASWMYQYVTRYKKFVREYRQEYACEPSETEIRAFLRVSKERLDKIRKAVNKANVKSLDMKITKEDDSLTLGDMIASDDSMEDQIIKKNDNELMRLSLWEAVGTLPEEQKIVICKRYNTGMTQVDIGKIIGKSRTRVATLEQSAIRTLRSDKRSGYKIYYEQYMRAHTVRHVGRTEFNRTWYSEVEREVLGY